MDERERGDVRRYGRRTFLGVTAVGISSLWWGDALWQRLNRAAAPLQDALPEGFVPSGWRIYTVAATMPRFDPASWRLAIGGLVERPVSLSYDELRALPRAEQVSTFHCVTGWTVQDVRWAGVRFDHLLAAAKLKPEAHALTFVSAEKPYTDSLTLQPVTQWKSETCSVRGSARSSSYESVSGCSTSPSTRSRHEALSKDGIGGLTL